MLHTPPSIDSTDSFSAPHGRRRRRGAVLVETAIVFGTCLLLLLGMLDLAIAELRYNLLSEAARAVARRAIVHGAKAPPQRPAWGPATLEMTVDSSHESAALARNILVTMKPRDVNLRLEWLDGGNQYGQRLRVSLNYEHRWLTVLTGLSGPAHLSAVSTMYIAH